jgi:FHA domain
MSSRTITLDDTGMAPAGQWTLTVLDHGDASQRGRRVVVPVGESLCLGRDRSEGFTALDDPSVSRRHVRLEATDDALAVTDLGSSNGTFHLGARVSATRVQSGEVLRLGGVTLVARRTDATLPDVAGFGVPARSPAMARAVAQILDVAARGRVLLRGPAHAGVDAVAGALLREAAPMLLVPAAAPMDAAAREDLLSRMNARVALVGPMPLADARWQDDLLAALGRASGAGVTVLWWPDRDDAADDLAREALSRALGVVPVALPPLRDRAEDLVALITERCGRTHRPAPRLHPRLLDAMLAAPWPDDLADLARFVDAHLHPPADGAALALTPAMESALGTRRAPDPAPTPRAALRVAADGTWFEPAEGPRVSLEGRFALARVLFALVDARMLRPGCGVDVHDLLARAWPGQRPVGDSGPHRVHVAISTLRRLGLGDVLTRAEQGYLLAPTRCEIVR